MAELGSLLRELHEASVSRVAAPPTVGGDKDNELAQVRLGMASSLFAALRYRHAPTATHSLRVALSCSAWAKKLGIPAPHRDTIEVAALLHDIGVIGVPDHILLKPGALDGDESSVIADSRRMGLDILQHCAAAEELLLTVEHIPAWYNGSLQGFHLKGRDLPPGSQMISIVEAFDSMTSDRVYRPALSLEAAVTELFHCAGTQFSPEFLRLFAEFQCCDQKALHEEVARRWLRPLDPELVDSYWQLNYVSAAKEELPLQMVFQLKLLESMYDAVVFVDAGMRIIAWNRGAERLTGITAPSVIQNQWTTELLKLHDERGVIVKAKDCPVLAVLRSGVPSLRRLTVVGRSGRGVAVDTHTIPVPNRDGALLGAILLMHDASSEASLQERCQNLHQKATLDPMTQVANRAEFDRVLAMFVTAHQEQRFPCAMMICDLDRFKRVNDTYGHQAGDDAIKSLAALMKSCARAGDLVARYGGEEFVMLCADCDNATAARRAEEIRRKLSVLPQPRLEGNSISASFGVTEVQPGDTPETMLRRADRALLMAKARGRNCVVQIGTGGSNDTEAASQMKIKIDASDVIARQDLITPVPIKIAIEKLRGFVADHQARIVSIEDNNLQLEISDGKDGWFRRLSDRPITFCLDLQLEELRGAKDDTAYMARTRMRVEVSLRKNRDRRRQDLAERARTMLTSFRSYLMASEAAAEESPPASPASES
jgi:diguanylate cyclase (GGDEF)-like protein/PAS domain S-box-containing protein